MFRSLKYGEQKLMNPRRQWLISRLYLWQIYAESHHDDYFDYGSVRLNQGKVTKNLLSMLQSALVRTALGGQMSWDHSAFFGGVKHGDVSSAYNFCNKEGWIEHHDSKIGLSPEGVEEFRKTRLRASILYNCYLAIRWPFIHWRGILSWTLGIMAFSGFSVIGILYYLGISPIPPIG